MKQIKKGCKVKWTCNPKDSKPFECIGIVDDLYMSTFGSCNRCMGARIKVTSKKYKDWYNKNMAFVSVKNLRLA